METNLYNVAKKHDIDLYTFNTEMLLELDNIEKYSHICDEDIKNVSIIFDLPPYNIHEYIKNFKLFLVEMDSLLSRQFLWSGDINQNIGEQTSILADLMTLFSKNLPILDQVHYIHKYIYLCLKHKESEYYQLILNTDKKFNSFYPLIDSITKNSYKLMNIE